MVGPPHLSPGTSLTRPGPTGKEDEASSSLDLEKCITFGPLHVGPVRTARAGKKETFPSHFYVAGAAAAGRKDKLLRVRYESWRTKTAQSVDRKNFTKFSCFNNGEASSLCGDFAMISSPPRC
jgi:hypothetical protein